MSLYTRTFSVGSFVYSLCLCISYKLIVVLIKTCIFENVHLPHSYYIITEYLQDQVITFFYICCFDCFLLFLAHDRMLVASLCNHDLSVIIVVIVIVIIVVVVGVICEHSS